VNRSITHLFVLFTVLFAVLVGFTSRWTVFEAESLENQTANRRGILEEARIPRGTIFAADGTRLTRNIPRGSGKTRTYKRSYPTGNLFSHPVGYSFIDAGRAGIEKFRNRALVGKESEFGTVFQGLGVSDREGKDVRTTLDPAAQRTAVEALGGQPGSIVAMEPSTGRVRVMVSIPDFNPNEIPQRKNQLNSLEGSPLLNRATQGQSPPGSTFKVVTAAAALDSGKFTPDSVLDGASPRDVGGAPLSNAGGQSFGPITLTQALTNSVNTVWAQVGEQIGPATLLKYMQRFGFNADVPLDYPKDEIVPSGIYGEGGLVKADSGFDVGRVAIGQGGAEGQILVSSLQMAMVASAVGNGGVLMEPRLTDSIVSKDGRKEEIKPTRQSRVMSEETAGQLGEMMSQVVREGSGTAGALAGISVAGKTGTAQVENNAANQAWFIAFAPAEDPKMAVAVTVERTQGTGGEVAGPLAKRVLQQLLGDQAGG